MPTANANLQAIQELHATLVKEKKVPNFVIKAVEDDQGVAFAWISHAEGRNDEATKALREIATREQGIFSPDGGIPAHEMLGDMLSEMGQPEQALTEYEAELKLNPNRFDSLYGAGRAAEILKLSDRANGYFNQLVKICAGTNSSRPELTYARGALSTVAKRD